MLQPLWKTVWQFLTVLNIELPYDQAMLLLGIYPGERKTYVHARTCTRMSTAGLVIVTEQQKPPKCPSAGEDARGDVRCNVIQAPEGSRDKRHNVVKP